MMAGRLLWIIGGLLRQKGASGVACCLAALVASAPWSAVQPPAAADCMRLVANATQLYGAEVSPGEVFEQVWQVENCGDTTWEGYRAVRSSGDVGPSAFDVPPLPPGATGDLAVIIEAPSAAGWSRAAYRLEGSRGLFGDELGVILLTLGADCDRAAPLSAPGEPPDARALVISAGDLGTGWCLLAGGGVAFFLGSEYGAIYRNWSDYAAPLTVTIGLWYWQPRDVSLGPPESYCVMGVGDLYLSRRLGAQAVAFTEWPLGDGPAFRRLHVANDDRWTEVEYVFCAGPTTVAISVLGPPDLEEELDALALRVAATQETRIRAILNR